MEKQTKVLRICVSGRVTGGIQQPGNFADDVINGGPLRCDSLCVGGWMDGYGATKSTRHAAAEWHLAKNRVGSGTTTPILLLVLLAKLSKKYRVAKCVADWLCS